MKINKKVLNSQCSRSSVLDVSLSRTPTSITPTAENFQHRRNQRNGNLNKNGLVIVDSNHHPLSNFLEDPHPGPPFFPGTVTFRSSRREAHRRMSPLSGAGSLTRHDNDHICFQRTLARDSHLVHIHTARKLPKPRVFGIKNEKGPDLNSLTLGWDRDIFQNCFTILYTQSPHLCKLFLNFFLTDLGCTLYGISKTTDYHRHFLPGLEVHEDRIHQV